MLIAGSLGAGRDIADAFIIPTGRGAQGDNIKGLEAPGFFFAGFQLGHEFRQGGGLRYIPVRGHGFDIGNSLGFDDDALLGALAAQFPRLDDKARAFVDGGYSQHGAFQK